MKRMLILALIPLLGMMSSCGEKESSNLSILRERSVSITTTLPQCVSSYAEDIFSDDKSDKGGLSNVDESKADLRYIVEFYEKDSGKLSFRIERVIDANFKEAQNFTATLMAKVYTVAVWVDFLEEGNLEGDYTSAERSDKDNFYATQNGLKAVEMKSESSINISDEMKDAYCGSEELNLMDGNQEMTLKLQRPFTKLRFIASDVVENLNTIQPSYATVKYECDLATMYNVVDKSVVEGKSLTAPIERKSMVKGVKSVWVNNKELTMTPERNGQPYYVVAFDYLFVGEEKAQPITITLYDENDGQIGLRASEITPLETNKLITLLGNFFSNEGELSVSIVDDFIEVSENEI